MKGNSEHRAELNVLTRQSVGVAIGVQIATIRPEFIASFRRDVLQLTPFLLYGFVVAATSRRAVNVAIQWHIDRKGDEISANPSDQLGVR